VREETLQQSDNEIASLGKKARDLAVSVEAVREETLLHSNAEMKELKQDARNLALTTEISRIKTLMESDKVIRKLNEDLEQRVLERTGQLEAANKELEAFSYSVSHDLRAPLRAIDGFSRILLEDHAENASDEARGYLKLVRDNTRQMGQLVDDLLAFSRLGRLPLTKHTVDQGKIVRLCLVEMQQEQEGRRLEIVIGDLPSCQADPTLLKQVWMNLLSNALKYTRKQEIARIEIGCRMEHVPNTNGQASNLSGPGTSRVYFVTDNGAGFDMKYAHKLFGVFQRLHRAADYDGTGVGLAIVQRIINRHGGRVWGAAQLKLGATFSFTLA
jgi:light-regulated signal transduction histidine kinase (bacteriophytochrome)